MRSRLFYTDRYLILQQRIKTLLNAQEDYLTSITLRSTRAVGDAVQEVLAQNFPDILGDFSTKCSVDFARRAMADMAFEDRDGIYYVVDVKTHRAETKCNMPNLISVDRLAKFYESDSNYFLILLVSYAVEGSSVVVSDVNLAPIEFFSWECLTLGALGWGQIQIANSNRVVLKPQYSRREWMTQLCDELLEFYPKEIAKIGKRIERFESLRDAWQAREDVWRVPPIEDTRILE